MCVRCLASTQITLHLLFLSWGDAAAERAAFLAIPWSVYSVCVCVFFCVCTCACALKPSSEHVKNSCGERMLLLPLGLLELQTDRREELIEGFQCEHVRARVLKRKRLATFFSSDTFQRLRNLASFFILSGQSLTDRPSLSPITRKNTNQIVLLSHDKMTRRQCVAFETLPSITPAAITDILSSPQSPPNRVSLVSLAVWIMAFRASRACVCVSGRMWM